MSTETVDQHAIASGRTFVWHEVYVPNAQKAIDFYCGCLGFETRPLEMGDMGTYHLLIREGTPVAGIMSTDNPQMASVPPHWASYLSVDDVDAKVAKCQGAGAVLVVPAMDVPAVGRMALIQDPQGAHIWLFKGATE